VFHRRRHGHSDGTVYVGSDCRPPGGGIPCPNDEGTMGATLAKLLDGLERRCTWRNAALAVGGIVLSNLAMGGYIIPNIEARRPEAMKDGFLAMIDVAPLSSAEEVYRIFDLYTPDILGFVRLLYALDFVMPLMFAVLMLCLMGKMLRYLEVKEGAWRAALLLPFTGLLFDYTENASSLFLIGQYQDGQVFPTLARVASIATAAKFLGLGCSGLTMVVLLFRAAMKRIARRAA
jgi:hypothetical protein